MSSAARNTLSLRKREAIAVSKPSTSGASITMHSGIRQPCDLDSPRLVHERKAYLEHLAKRADVQRELDACQATIASLEVGGADSRVMPHRRAMRELKEKLSVLDKRVQHHVDAVLGAQKHQDDWYAMREDAHRAWGFALAQDYIAGGVDPVRWRETLETALASSPNECAVAIEGLDLVKDMKFNDDTALAGIYSAWGKAIEHAITQGKILADDMIDVLKQQMVADARRRAIIAVHHLIEHAPPQIEHAEEELYQPRL